MITDQLGCFTAGGVGAAFPLKYNMKFNTFALKALTPNLSLIILNKMLKWCPQ